MKSLSGLRNDFVCHSVTIDDDAAQNTEEKYHQDDTLLTKCKENNIDDCNGNKMLSKNHLLRSFIKKHKELDVLQISTLIDFIVNKIKLFKLNKVSIFYLQQI